jgi:hypothetical protein
MDKLEGKRRFSGLKLLAFPELLLSRLALGSHMASYRQVLVEFKIP